MPTILLCNTIAWMFLGIPFSSEPLQDETIYTVSEVSVKPEPYKGLKDFQDNWRKKVKYPEEALEKNVQGMVFIEFVVNRDSTITDAAIRQGIGSGCDEAALKGFKEVTKTGWKPGIRSGKPVKVKMVVPFYFRIIRQ